MNQDAESVLAAANVLRELLRPIVERLDAQDARIAALEQRPISITDGGVWQQGQTYAQAVGVTHDGGYWVSQRQTSDQPGDGNASWRLAVHRGRQGRQGERGPQGPPGRDAENPTFTEARR